MHLGKCGMIMFDMNFYKNKKVLITGHTGFKGTWLTKILIDAGANLTGIALKSSQEPDLFHLCQLESKMNSIIGDMRDFEFVYHVFEMAKPEIVIHLAAQALVKESYINPLYTYETNVMGTVHVCECIRLCSTVKSFLNVTTDKVYRNNEWVWGYREQDELDGYDPYSNSKSCSELITRSYANSFFENRKIAISTARAGNVIGGGDFSNNRIIPDCIRSALANKVINIRNPNSIRPYQHVLEALFAYLMLVQRQYEDQQYAGNYNIGPDDRDCITTRELVEKFCDIWGKNQTWRTNLDYGPHEAQYLKLDCSKIKHILGWKPTWNIEQALIKTIEWSKIYQMGKDVEVCMEKQIKEFISSDKTDLS